MKKRTAQRPITRSIPPAALRQVDGAGAYRLTNGEDDGTNGAAVIFGEDDGNVPGTARLA